MTIITLITALILNFAQASEKEGHGGWTMVRETGGKIDSIQLWDLWIAREEFDLTVLKSDDSAEALARARVRTLMEIDETMFRKVAIELEKILQLKRILSDRVELEPSPDLIRRLRSREGFEPKPFVKYFPNGDVQLNRIYWDWFKNQRQDVDIAAAFVHEAVYKVYRSEYNDTDSDRAVTLVAHAFSDLPLDELKKRYKRGFAPPPTSVPQTDTQVSIEIHGKAAASVKEALANWKTECDRIMGIIPKQLGDKVFYAYVFCGKPQDSEEFHGDYDTLGFVRSLGHVVLLPKLPLHTLETRLFGGYGPGENEAAKKRAYNGLFNRCEEWTETYSKRLGDRLLFSSCGHSEIDSDRRIRSEEWVVPQSGVRGYRRFNYATLGYAATSWATLLIFADPAERIAMPMTQYEGKAYRFRNDLSEEAVTEARNALYWAYETYLQACEETDILKDKRVLFVACRPRSPKAQVKEESREGYDGLIQYIGHRRVYSSRSWAAP